MKKILFAAILAAVTLAAPAQSQKITHYNKEGEITSREHCSYYEVRIKTSSGTDSMRSFYCANDRPKAFYQTGPKGYSGRYVAYFPNGNVFVDGDCDQGDTLRVFYENGAVRYEQVAAFQGNDVQLIRYVDERGKPMVERGNGFCDCRFIDIFGHGPTLRHGREVGKIADGVRDSVWMGYDSTGFTVYREKYEIGKLISGVSFTKEGEQYGYTVIGETATPVGGLSRFYEMVSKNIKYPRTARREGIQGKVYVSFIVEKDGSLSEIATIKGIGGGCDEEAERAIGLSPKWTIPRQRGKPVRQKMVLPINFRL